MAKAYAVGVGLILILVGVLGFVRTEMFGLQFNQTHNFIHIATGAVGLFAGLSKSARAPRAFAQVFGAAYTLLAILGFAGVPAALTTALLLNTTYNVIHLVVGLLGLLAGFTGAAKQAMA